MTVAHDRSLPCLLHVSERVPSSHCGNLRFQEDKIEFRVLEFTTGNWGMREACLYFFKQLAAIAGGRQSVFPRGQQCALVTTRNCRLVESSGEPW